jgi:hypothetical protein
MIKTIPNLPENILGFRAVGQVTAKDYEQEIIPAVLAMSERLHHVRMLYVLDEDFEGYSTGAMWDDALLGVSRYTAWERIAVVTDVPWMRTAVQAVHFFMPGTVKLYHLNEIEQAKVWLTH